MEWKYLTCFLLNCCEINSPISAWHVIQQFPSFLLLTSLSLHVISGQSSLHDVFVTLYVAFSIGHGIMSLQCSACIASSPQTPSAFDDALEALKRNRAVGDVWSTKGSLVKFWHVKICYYEVIDYHSNLSYKMSMRPTRSKNTDHVMYNGFARKWLGPQSKSIWRWWRNNIEFRCNLWRNTLIMTYYYSRAHVSCLVWWRHNPPCAGWKDPMVLIATFAVGGGDALGRFLRVRLEDLPPITNTHLPTLGGVARKNWAWTK